MKVYKSDSPQDTMAAAAELAASLKPGSVVALTGDLGSGKTVFVKGIADYFNVTNDVISPTYTLVNEYDGDIGIYHFDVYRLLELSPDDRDWIDEYLFGDGVCLIEWADNIKTVLPENTIWVEIKKVPEKGMDCREIEIC